MPQILVSIDGAPNQAAAQVPPPSGVQVLVQPSMPGALTVITAGKQGPAGPVGETGDSILTKTASRDMSGHRAVIFDGAGKADYASAANASHVGRLAGITLGAALEGTPINVRAAGEIVEPSWAWDVDVPVFLGLDGHLTQVPGDTAGAVFTQVVGMPTSATSLFISPGQPITLA